MALPRPNADPQVHRELQALKGWRDNAIRAHRIGPNVITDTHLTEIVMRGRKHIPAVQQILHTSVKGLAEEIIQVQHAAGTAPARPDPTQPIPPAPSQPARSQPARPTVPSPTVPPPTSGPTSSGPAQTGPAQTGPAQTGPAQTGPAQTRPAQTGADLEQLRLHVLPHFAPITAVPARATKPGTIRPVPLPSGLRLRWPSPSDPDPIVLHRVVARDDVPPYSPVSGELVDIVTLGSPPEPVLSTLDPRPPAFSVRFFAVFEYSGRSLDEAYETQPTLVAEGRFVFGIGGLELREEDGLVIGRWTTAPGATRVLVYRIPLEQLAMGAGQDPAYLLDAADPHLRGFVDHDASPGQRYRYDMVVEVVRGDVTLQSDAASAEVAISAPLVAVTDLRVDPRFADDGSPRFDVSWTKPATGEVVLFRTERAPVPGATNGVHDVAVLPQLGLGDDDHQKMPVTSLGADREGIGDVRGKAGWSRIHFTPATLLNGSVRIGTTRTVLVVGVPVEPEVVERCDHQVLKFGWPDGAAKVIVAPRGPNDPVAVPVGGPGYDEIDKDTWEKLGGLQFRALLPPDGCAVHLAGVAFEAGGAVFGRPVSVGYPGLIRLWYALEARQRRFRLDRLVVRVAAEREPSPMPALVLVHRPDRLPLHLHDGAVLPVTPDIPQVAQASRHFRPDRLPRDTSEASSSGWFAEVRGLTGFVRLFIDGPPGRIALLDPPAASLQLRA